MAKRGVGRPSGGGDGGNTSKSFSSSSSKSSNKKKNKNKGVAGSRDNPAKSRAQLENRASARRYNQSIKEFEAQKANTQMEVDMFNEATRAKYEYGLEQKAAGELAQIRQYQKNLKDVRTQLKYNKQDYNTAVKSQTDVFNQRVGEIEQTKQDQRIAMERTRIANQFNVGTTRLNAKQTIEAANLKLEESLSSSELARKGANLDYKQTGLSIESERSQIKESQDLLEIQDRAIDFQERNAVADRNFEMVKATIENIQASGAAAARGQRGVSARNTQQSLLAAFAIDTAQISDALYRTKTELDFERESVDVKQAGLERQSGILGKKESLAKDRLNLAIEQADVSDRFARATRDTAVSQAKASRDLQLKNLSKTFDIDKRVFSMNISRLGEELVSAAKARKTAIKGISRGKVRADNAANASRMLDPREFFLPDPPRPHQMEMPVMVPPPEPDAITREMFQVPQPEKPSGMSSALGGIGMVAGLVATVATAGAAIPAVAAAVPSLGTIGAVAGGVSKGATMLSSYTQ